MKTTKTSIEKPAPENLPAAIGSAILDFRKQCADVAASQIELTNRARAIGCMVQSWCGHQQMNFQFFQNHRAELPKEISFTALKNFVAIARRLPGKVDTLADARRVWQATFESAGLLELPERTERQNPASVSRFVELVKCLGKVREVLSGWNRDQPFETWTAETRQAVAAQIEPLAKFHRQLTEETQ